MTYERNLINLINYTKNQLILNIDGLDKPQLLSVFATKQNANKNILNNISHKIHYQIHTL